MIGVDEARARLFAASRRMPAESVALGAAVGRTLAEPLRAQRSQPPFPASAMDGYAIRASDVAEGPLQVVGQSAAGARYHGHLGVREAVRIFTGAPVPEGADAVLIQEDAQVDNSAVIATEPVRAGQNIRRAALDFAEGDTLLQAGTTLAPRHVALAGAGGHGTLKVMRRPVVAFLATGDELVAPGTTPGPDGIIASTTPALAALVRRAGGEAIDLGIAPDNQAVIAQKAKAGIAQADILVTLGGASVGDHDLVRPALADLGVTLDFWKVAVRPGKPLMFASDPLVLGLPGNPVSGVVCTLLFLAPLVESMLGVAHPGPHAQEGVLGGPLGKNGPRRDHVRARLDNGRLVPFPVQDSSMLGVLAKADALIVRPPHAPPASAGEACAYLAL
ncbi:MAG: gephyrin-like molybdotransferase Glp [Pseudomonadota bacterium]